MALNLCVIAYRTGCDASDCFYHDQHCWIVSFYDADEQKCIHMCTFVFFFECASNPTNEFM